MLIDVIFEDCKRHLDFLKRDHPLQVQKQEAWEDLQRMAPPNCDDAYRYTPILEYLAEIYKEGPYSMSFGISPTSMISPILAIRNDYARDWFLLWNTVLFEEGGSIYISGHEQKPVWIRGAKAQKEFFSQVRIQIHLGPDSSATVINDMPLSGNIVTEIYLDVGAQLDYYNLQFGNKKGVQVHTVDCVQSKYSTFRSYSFIHSETIIRNNLYVRTAGTHTTTDLYGLCYLGGKQHIDNHTVIDHCHSYTKSYELYKGVFGGLSTGVFHGNILIRPDVEKVQAYQQNNNLILHNGAKAYTKPHLEIWSDDVKCTHGATTMQIDKEQLFYLCSRGIPYADAVELLHRAFMDEIFMKVSNLPLRSYITQQFDGL